MVYTSRHGTSRVHSHSGHARTNHIVPKRNVQYYSYANKDSIGDIYTGYSLREEGMSWLLSNQNMFVLKQEQQPELSDDDIPF